MILGSIIQILFFFLTFAVIYKLINAFKKGALLQKLNLKWVLSVYGILLLLAVRIFYILPNERASNKIVISQEELSKAEKSRQLLTMAAAEGKQIPTENIDGVQIKNQWDFTYEGKKLEITA